MTESVRYEDLKTKKARVEFLREKLSTDARWASRGLLRIYEYQTTDEKATQDTRHWNNVGFSGVDAEILSSFAEQLLKGRTLSEKQMAIVFRKMKKYARQLDGVAQAKKEVK